MSYDPDTWRVREENLRLARELRAERDQHHELRISNAKKEVLSAQDIDHPIVEAMLDGGKPRVIDGKVVINFGDNKVGTMAEAMQHWRDNPQQFGYVVAIKPQREPTRQEKHLEWLRGLTMGQQMAYRQKRGPNYLEPEPE